MRRLDVLYFRTHLDLCFFSHTSSRTIFIINLEQQKSMRDYKIVLSVFKSGLGSTSSTLGTCLVFQVQVFQVERT